jgi:ankyrin repeat protein
MQIFDDNTSTLIMASEHGYLEIVQTLLGRGADVHHSNSHDDTALHKASEKGHIEVVRALLEAGAERMYAEVMKMALLRYLMPVRGSTWRYSEPWWRREETWTLLIQMVTRHSMTPLVWVHRGSPLPRGERSGCEQEHYW